MHLSSVKFTQACGKSQRLYQFHSLCSAKFAQKVVYANRLSDLEDHLRLPQLDIPEPERVKK